MNTFRTIIAALIVPLALVAAAAPADAARRPSPNPPAYCPAYDTGRISAPGVDNSITVTAPSGYLILGVCYQTFTATGTAVIREVIVFPMQKSYTITAARDIGHYSLLLELE